MLPETAAPPHHCLPKPRLAFMDAGRGTLSERRAIETGADTLLVHGVAGLVPRREKGVAKGVLVDVGSDADVASGKPGAERMMREVDPAPLEIVTQALQNTQSKIELGRLGKRLPQTGVIGGRLLAD